LATFLLVAGVWICSRKAIESGAGRPAEGGSRQRAGVVSSPPQPAPIRNVPAIVIDPGHGGLDPGTVANGQFEKTWTLSLGLALAGELQLRGWPVEMTRLDDRSTPLPERCALANQRRRLAFVSIHLNAGGPDASGIETYFTLSKSPEAMARSHSDTAQDRFLAEALQREACAAIGAKDRGARSEGGYFVLNHTACPAVLVECGFLTNAAECQEIQNASWRQKLVRGLADGLEAWLLEPGTVAGNAAGTAPGASIPIATPASRNR
jgi:N-acetylmuramoyl-L-alanine amidase